MIYTSALWLAKKKHTQKSESSDNDNPYSNRHKIYWSHIYINFSIVQLPEVAAKMELQHFSEKKLFLNLKQSWLPAFSQSRAFFLPPASQIPTDTK